MRARTSPQRFGKRWSPPIPGLVRTALTDWGLGDLVDDARLIVSEFVGNAAKTGRQRRMRVEIALITSTNVRISVTDGSRTLPVRIGAGPVAEGGRGLHLVHDLTRGQWGATRAPDGKTVHADLELRSTP
ncbi:ATP-binding protein [Kitasatospora xanthocidica]|uniref:ATP-binding protein n=1 Tax=Kitasatospora xanthocidica TaxID=83382 RepID=UPI0036EFC748